MYLLNICNIKIICNLIIFFILPKSMQWVSWNLDFCNLINCPNTQIVKCLSYVSDQFSKDFFQHPPAPTGHANLMPQATSLINYSLNIYAIDAIEKVKWMTQEEGNSTHDHSNGLVGVSSSPSLFFLHHVHCLFSTGLTLLSLHFICVWGLLGGCRKQ